MGYPHEVIFKVDFAQWCEVIDEMNAAALLRIDKVENGWQLTCPVTSG